MKLVVKDDATIQHGRVVLGTSAGAKCRTSLDGDLLRQLTQAPMDKRLRLTPVFLSKKLCSNK